MTAEHHDFEVRRLAHADASAVLEAGRLFDRKPQRHWTTDFLGREGHHLFVAYVAGEPAGFVTGIEMTHPDKGPEMMLYELGVAEAHRRRGIGTALAAALVSVAREVGCRGMWVPIEPDDAPAVATYRAAGADEPAAAAIMSWEFGERS